MADPVEHWSIFKAECLQLRDHVMDTTSLLHSCPEAVRSNSYSETAAREDATTKLERIPVARHLFTGGGLALYTTYTTVHCHSQSQKEGMPRALSVEQSS